mgnify:CR=1
MSTSVCDKKAGTSAVCCPAPPYTCAVAVISVSVHVMLKSVRKRYFFTTAYNIHSASAELDSTAPSR